MKKVILKILKYFLIFTVIILVAILVFGVVLSLDWPWWVGVFILSGLLGMWFVFMLIRKILLRRREKNFVHQVIEQDDAAIKKLTANEREGLKDLQGRWKEAIDALKSSHLRKFGNPLYVLPWYMIIGESGSGKTTAIQSARLSSPFAEISKTSGISGTRNCDWWFFEQAIIIDTAGRYSIPVDEGRDKEEWQRFLTLLAKFRKKEPLNGLVVTIGADKLLQSSSETLEEDGRNIRHRIDELMRVIGSKFPVYVLVTKCDLIQGMNQFCNRLPEKSHEQAMGLINRKLSTNVLDFHDRVSSSILDRLRELRLLLFHKESGGKIGQEGQGVEPGLLLFPEEFEKLNPQINAFIRGAFKENPYQETPVLRGLFYSSGRQEGNPYSHFLKALGLIGEQETLPGTRKGLFLHDLFSKILPKDRRLLAPTQRTLEWSRLTKNFGLTAWVAVTIALCGLLSFSFVKNLKILREVSQQFSKPPILQGEILNDVMTMDRFRQAIVDLESRNDNWWIPRFGLKESNEVEIELKRKYCRQFEDEFSAAFDKQMEDKMAVFSDSTSDEILGQHIAHLTRRVNLIKSRIADAGLDDLNNQSQPSYRPIVLVTDSKLLPEIRKRLATLYIHYLFWQKDKNSLTQEMQYVQTWLRHLLTLSGTNLNWLVAWANDNPDLPYIKLTDFWGDSLLGADDTMIPPAFTLNGKELIDTLINEIENALVDPLIITAKKQYFKDWYQMAYIKVWHDFGVVFPRGEYLLADKESWQQVASRMASDQGPYFLFLDRIASELRPFIGVQDLPLWVKLVFDIKAAKTQAIVEKEAEGKGVLAKASKKGKKLISKFERTVGKIPVDSNLSSYMIAGKAYNEYQKSLSEITLTSESRRVSYDMAVKLFSEDPATSQSPFFLSEKALSKLKTSLIRGHSLKDSSDEKIFWKLAIGPLYFLRDFVCLEAACYLNSVWEKDVLIEIEGMKDKSRINQLLFDQNGYAIKFIKGPAAPFINRSLRRGFYAKEVLERSLPFSDPFLSYLTVGIRIEKFEPEIKYDDSDSQFPDDSDLDPLLKLLLAPEMSSKSPPSPEPELPPDFKPDPEPEPVKSQYIVNIKALPTDVNLESKIRPHATTVELGCASGIVSLVNLNYPVQKSIKWEPDNCSEVVFKIEIGSLVLIKKYTSELSLRDFLKEFAGGKKIFSTADFPTHASELKRMGIKYIKVNYQFDGHQPILGLLTKKERAAKRAEQAKKAEEARKAWEDRKAREAERSKYEKQQRESQEMRTKDIGEILIEWEAKKERRAMEAKAAKEAIKVRKALEARLAKEAREAKIPNVPRNIATCWDQ